MTRIPRPLARFRVYPFPPTKWRYEVCVFANQAAMYGYGKRVWAQESPNYYAICVSIGQQDIKGCKLGEILFTTHGLTHKLISHEAVHASHHWMAARCGRDAVIINPRGTGHETEEWVAHATANVVEQIVSELRKREMAIT